MISIEVENLIRFKKINQIKGLYANVLFLWNDTLLKIRNYFIIIILFFVYSCENSGSGDFQADSLPISISSSPSENASIAFGQTYLHQLTTTNTDYYSGPFNYSLWGEPNGMTVSSSGMIEWTPNKASDIKTHKNIKILVETVSRYTLVKYFDITVTGTCISGNVLAIWKGDQRLSSDSSKFLGNITAYTDDDIDNCGRNNNLDCTAENNYEFDKTNPSSENLHIGPETSADDGIMFFYNQFDKTSNSYLFWMFGKGGSPFSPSPNYVKLDIHTAKNETSDDVVVSDDGGETNRESQSVSNGYYSSSYTARYKYLTKKSDGGVIGPFSGSDYRIFIDRSGNSLINSDVLSLGNLNSFVYWSKDNSSFSLGDVDNFTIGFKTTIDCTM